MAQCSLRRSKTGEKRKQSQAEVAPIQRLKVHSKPEIPEEGRAPGIIPVYRAFSLQLEHRDKLSHARNRQFFMLKCVSENKS